LRDKNNNKKMKNSKEKKMLLYRFLGDISKNKKFQKRRPNGLLVGFKK